MICQGMEDRLNDYAGGDLSEADRLEIEAHLASCAGCREAARDLKALLGDLASLPRRLEPSRDLWPETLAAMRRARPASGEGRAAPGRDALSRIGRFAFGPKLALAAGLIVLVGAAILLVARGRAAESPSPSPSIVPASGTAAGSFPDISEAEADFARATENLLVALKKRQNDLPPETLGAIEENLRIVDHAIAEARGALKRDPSNTRLGRIVTAAYQTKLDILSGAARLPTPG